MVDIIKIGIAEDQPLFRAGLIAILKNAHRIQPIFEAENGKELLEKLTEQQPDVILLDLEMPVMDGMEAAKQIRVTYPHIKILVLSNHDEDAFILHMIGLGANGYLLKDAEPREMEEAIRIVMATNYYFNDRVSGAMLNQLIKKENIDPTFNQEVQLTEREIETLQLICHEHNSREIAKKLSDRNPAPVSSRTVEGYRTSLLQKTGARNVAGLVMFALKYGYIKV